MEEDMSKKRKRTSPALAKVAAVHDLVGILPDHEVASRTGVHKNTVRNYRIKHGIAGAPRGRGSRTATRTAKRVTGRGSPLDDYVHLLGTMTDRDLAEQVGVSVGSFYQYRRNRGIPSFRTNRRSGAVGGTSPNIGSEGSTAKAPSTQARSTLAWKVGFANGEEAVVVGDSLVAAVRIATGVERGEIQAISRLGPALVE